MWSCTFHSQASAPEKNFGGKHKHEQNQMGAHRPTTAPQYIEYRKTSMVTMAAMVLAYIGIELTFSLCMLINLPDILRYK